MIDRCELTELLVDQCAHCKGHTGQPPKVDPVDVSHTFPARFPGPCANCDRRFAEDEEIGRLADGSGYVCSRCSP